jgi:hypothetical protein
LNNKDILFQKKGELTTQQTVMIITLLASFIVLLIFVVNLNFLETSEKAVCQSSIQMQSSGKTSFFSGIDCKIHYLCISGGGECEGFTYKDTEKINPNDKSSKDKIMKVIADEMADCWWMFGEGKVNYVSWKEIDSTACAVCTQFAFDESFEKYQPISYEDLYTFLKNTKRGEKQTYSEYMGITNVPAGSIDFTKKYSIYTGRVKSGALSSGSPIIPIILERDDFNTLKCSSFVTAP